VKAVQEIEFPVPFAKMSGAGNDFLVVDHRRRLVPEPLQAEFARLVCRRRFSVGADGLIFLEESDEADFSWRFYNADGSVAEMCGNGARCAARFAFLQGMAAAVMRFSTLAGVIDAQVQGRRVRVGMPSPRDLRLDVRLTVDGAEVKAHFLDTGVPHLVCFPERVDRRLVLEMGRALRFHPRFAPAGANVNFVETLGPHRLRVRTYERGVEGETHACGTGATAAAVVAAILGLAQPPVTVVTSGGETLVIDFKLAGSEAADVRMEGDALLVYRGELTQEALEETVMRKEEG